MNMWEWLLAIGVMGLLAFLAVIGVVLIYALERVKDVGEALIIRMDCWVSLLGKEGE